jgi:hypothetical protein
MFSFAITLSVSKPFDISLLVYLLVKEIVMYYDFDDDHATSRRRKWLQKIQQKKNLEAKLVVCFAFGFALGFAACVTLVSILERYI